MEELEQKAQELKEIGLEITANYAVKSAESVSDALLEAIAAIEHRLNLIGDHLGLRK